MSVLPILYLCISGLRLILLFSIFSFISFLLLYYLQHVFILHSLYNIHLFFFQELFLRSYKSLKITRRQQASSFPIFMPTTIHYNLLSGFFVLLLPVMCAIKAEILTFRHITIHFYYYYYYFIVIFTMISVLMKGLVSCTIL